MRAVFVVLHVHELDLDHEDVKLIGVYSSRQRAEEAVVRLSACPGFRDSPDTFHIDEYKVDRDHWEEGYV
jgi:hypothetical protein